MASLITEITLDLLKHNPEASYDEIHDAIVNYMEVAFFEALRTMKLPPAPPLSEMRWRELMLKRKRKKYRIQQKEQIESQSASIRIFAYLKSKLGIQEAVSGFPAFPEIYDGSTAITKEELRQPVMSSAEKITEIEPANVREPSISRLLETLHPPHVFTEFDKYLKLTREYDIMTLSDLEEKLQRGDIPSQEELYKVDEVRSNALRKFEELKMKPELSGTERLNMIMMMELKERCDKLLGEYARVRVKYFEENELSSYNLLEYSHLLHFKWLIEKGGYKNLKQVEDECESVAKEMLMVRGWAEKELGLTP